MGTVDPLLSELANGADVVVVLRNVRGGRLHHRGEIVDGGEWRNLASLIQRRYVSCLPYGYDMASAVEVNIDGVDAKFVNQQLADIALRNAPEEVIASTEEDQGELELSEDEDDASGTGEDEDESGAADEATSGGVEAPPRESESKPKPKPVGRGRGK